MAFPTSTSTAISASSPNNTLTARKHLQTSKVLHEELSNQLAQMATQLKRNAQHFSDSLVKDKAVVEEVQEKLEGNYTVMLKERLRLRDFRGKSGSTTWLVVGVIVAVLLMFVMMVGVIRFSRH
jgi:SNARE protein 1